MTTQIPDGRRQVSLSSFSHLFCQMVSHALTMASETSEVENMLCEIGYDVGARTLELVALRDHSGIKFPTRQAALQFVQHAVWRSLFAKSAERLEPNSSNSEEWFLTDLSPLTNRYVHVPEEYGELNCAAFQAGIIKGALCEAGAKCEVLAHTVRPQSSQQTAGASESYTVFAITFVDSEEAALFGC
ncbi:MAG: hypothetical protein MHM6MM_006027 [Cercozoa sp. M6MM]